MRFARELLLLGYVDRTEDRFCNSESLHSWRRDYFRSWRRDYFGASVLARHVYWDYLIVHKILKNVQWHPAPTMIRHCIAKHHTSHLRAE
jgi:hypothetical protein